MENLKRLKLVSEQINKPSSWNWFNEEDIPQFNYVCRTLGICPGPITILSAFSNTGKTFFAANLAICVANNLPVLGTIPIQSSGKVLHIDWDQGQIFSQIYYWRLLNGFRLSSFHNIDYFPPEFRLHDPNIKHLLLSLLEGYKLCIIDCLGSAIPEADINDDRVRAYIDLLNEVSEKTGCAILLLHHEPKNATGRDPLKSVKGNGSIISAAGGSIHLTREIGGTNINLQLGKKRLLKDFNTSYELIDVGDWSEKLGTEIGLVLRQEENVSDKIVENNLKLSILETINDHPRITTSEIKQKVNKRNEEVISIIHLLEKEDFIQIIGLKPKKHTITENGLSFLNWNKDIK